jgi:hypothetical protein
MRCIIERMVGGRSEMVCKFPNSDTICRLELICDYRTVELDPGEEHCTVILCNDWTYTNAQATQSI